MAEAADVWRKFRDAAVGLAALAIPGVGLLFSQSQASATLGREYVSLAVQVLGSAASGTDENRALRVWAVNTLNHYGTEKISPAVEKALVIQRVNMPVPMPCAPRLPPDPVYPDSDEALEKAPDQEGIAKLLFAGRIQRRAREQMLHDVLKACGTRFGEPSR